MIALVVTRSVRRRVTPSHALVDDLVHDTYLKLMANDLRALRDFDFQHENAVFGFLKTVASNVVMDYFRNIESQKRSSGQQDASLEEAAIFVPASRNTVQKVDREIMIHEIDEALKTQTSATNF